MIVTLARLARLARPENLAVAVTIALPGLIMACSPPSPRPSGDATAAAADDEDDERPRERVRAEGGGDAPPSAAEVEVTEAGDGGGGVSDVEAEPTAECLSRCAESLLPKCDGDENFCQNLCPGLSASVLDCLERSACTKEDWAPCLHHEDK